MPEIHVVKPADLKSFKYEENGRKTVKIPLTETAHFLFVKEYIEKRVFDFEESEYFKVGMRVIESDTRGFFGAKTKEELLLRCKKFIDLIEDIALNGLEVTPSVHKKDEDGDFVIHNGHHRCAIALNLGYDLIMVHENDETLQEFSKAERVRRFEELILDINSGKREVYQPVPEGFANGFSVGRLCSDRLKMIRGEVKPNSKILDVGACLGYFSRNLARDGHNVLAIDIDEKYVRAMEMLEFDDPSGAEYAHISLALLGDDVRYRDFDYGVVLAVLHHTMMYSMDEAIRSVKVLDQCVKRGIFVEIGTDSEGWVKKGVNHDTLRTLIEENTGFKKWTNLGTTRWETRVVYYVERE